MTDSWISASNSSSLEFVRYINSVIIIIIILINALIISDVFLSLNIMHSAELICVMCCEKTMDSQLHLF